MAESGPDHDALITQFCSLTGVAPHEAQQYLDTNQWDLSSAAAEYYTSVEEGAIGAQQDEHMGDDPAGAPQPTTSGDGGGRSLGSGPTSQGVPATSSPAPPPAPSQPPKKKFATLSDLGGGSSSHTGHGHDDDDDDDDSENHDLFTGGEKSGLAVQNPDDLKRKILERAKKNANRPGGDDPRPATSRFTGTARTLGGDEAESQVIEDPRASTPQSAPPVERHLHFWADGFSVDDGPLFRSDDPANAGYLAAIRSGRAPLAIMNVTREQEVDVKLEQHSEKYIKPKTVYKPFSGGGQRLGSPTPGPGSASTSEEAKALPGSFPTEVPTQTSQPSEAVAPTVDLNNSEPTIRIQIRLGDGTRLTSQFNTTHTVGDVYSFVAASSPSSANREWALMTTFPSKELADKAQELGKLDGFSKGGVVVQKWL